MVPSLRAVCCASDPAVKQSGQPLGSHPCVWLPALVRYVRDIHITSHLDWTTVQAYLTLGHSLHGPCQRGSYDRIAEEHGSERAARTGTLACCGVSA